MEGLSMMPLCYVSPTRAAAPKKLAVNPRRRLGFTLIELLVVIAIMGVLAGMLMQGVQKAREAARRIECSNNLRNIGFAIQNYDSAYSHMPSESNKGTNPDFGMGGTVPSFYAQLCDNLELANTCLTGGDPTKPIPGSQAKVYICPSRRTPTQAPGGRDYGYCQSNGSSVLAILDYQGCISVGQVSNISGSSMTAILTHLWLSPQQYNSTSAGMWSDTYPKHSPSVSGNKIFKDTDPSGTGQLGTPHTNAPTVFADNHIGALPLTFPGLNQIFSVTAPRQGQIGSIP
jgi:prepilin-type N-terminal cleavage/methylation domain-containing protein